MSDKITSPTSPKSSSKNGNGARLGNGDPSASANAGANRGDLSLKNDVMGLGTDVKAIAGDVAREAQKLAEARLDTGKGFVAESFGSVAGAIRNTGDQLRESPVGPVSGYLGDAADSIQQASKYLENKSVGEVVSDVEDFARREPLIFLGGTFALGLLVGRFLKSASPDPRGRAERERYDAPPPPRRESLGAASSTASSSPSSMGGSTTGGSMGAGKLPSFDTPLTNGPITNGPITTGPVSTESSVGTDLPVQPVVETITPLRTTGTSHTTSGGTSTPAAGDVKKTDG